MVYAVLYLQIVTRNKATDVHVMDLEGGKSQRVNENKSLYKVRITTDRSAEVYHEAVGGKEREFHRIMITRINNAEVGRK